MIQFPWENFLERYVLKVQINSMENLNIEAIKEPASRYTLTQNSLNDFLDSLKNLFIENSNLIMDANKVDIKHSKKHNKNQQKAANFVG